jgi:NAD(P)-dependent dehydrogenase (short-subunit alcohol dehydrogenase family)
MGPQRAVEHRDDVRDSDHTSICVHDGWRGTGELTGMHAVVTGATKEIGKAVVRRLLAAGAHVTVLDRDAERLEAEYGDTCERIAGAFDRTGEGRRLAGRVLRRRPAAQLIVHNHEVATSQDVLDLDEDGFDEAFNPKEPLFFVRELVRGLVAGQDPAPGRVPSRGRVVFIAPAYADPFDQDLSHVRAVSACRSLTDMAADLRRVGVRANMIEPGWVREEGAPPPPAPELWHGGPCTPDDVARLAMCLLSDDCTRLVSGGAFGSEAWRPHAALLGQPA